MSLAPAESASAASPSLSAAAASPSASAADRAYLKGVLAGCLAHVIWGFSVLFWPLMRDLPAVSIMAHRILWSCLLLVLVLGLTRRAGEVAVALKNRRVMLTMAFCAFLLAWNWGLYLWAVNNGHVAEASLGYFITPLLNVIMGRVLLGERLSRPQGLAILLVMLGVGWSVIGYGHMPWLGLAVALTFAVYGYFQKTVKLEAAPSLFLETAILAPFALAWLLVMHPGDLGGVIGHGAGRTLLLLSTGLLTAVPLLLFSYAARHVTLATVGIIQYINPSICLLLAIFVMHEAVNPSAKVTFPFIWAALAVYTWDAVRSMRAMRASARRAATAPAPENSAATAAEAAP